MVPFDASVGRWVEQDSTTEFRPRRLRVQSMEGRKNLKNSETSNHNEVWNMYFGIRPPCQRAIDRQVMHLKERGAFGFLCAIGAANGVVLFALLSRMDLLEA